MWRFIAFGLVMLATVAAGFSLVETDGSGEIAASAVISGVSSDSSAYARAIDPWDWHFPADFGPHPEFQTEWWYYTGNVADDSGRRFGFQFTIFRRAILPEEARSESEWRSDQVYMGHFTLSDMGDERFYHAERFSREGADLAGSSAEPRYQVWLEDWSVQALDDAAQQTRIQAAMPEGVAIDMQLTQVKPVVFQGENGLSPKSDAPGNASYYYTLPRLATEGEIVIDEQRFTVEGFTWKDHEFSSSALGPDALGWDWFGLIFDDGREMTIGRIRLVDGESRSYSGEGDSLALLVEADGSSRYIPRENFQIEALDTWTSPHSGAEYPSGWQVTIDEGEQPWSFTIAPMLPDQELYGSGIVYWEGAVQLNGDVGGYGYAELTGYVDALTGRF